MNTTELVKWYQGKIKEGFSEEEIDNFLDTFEDSITPFLLTGEELREAIDKKKKE